MRILIADDHAVVRFGLKTILSHQEGWQVVGEAKSGAEALALTLQLQPDIVVLDINMPGMNGLDALKAIRERVPATRAVILTLHSSVELVREIKRFGGPDIAPMIWNMSRPEGVDRSRLSRKLTNAMPRASSSASALTK